MVTFVIFVWYFHFKNFFNAFHGWESIASLTNDCKEVKRHSGSMGAQEFGVCTVLRTSTYLAQVD